MNLVFITGGATGIGKACAEMFLQNGAQVVINYLNSQKEADEIVQKFPKQALAVQGDASNENDIKKMFDATEKHFGGKVNILVNNAGVVNRQKFPELDAKTFAHTLQMNTIAPYLVSREFAVRLGKEGGSIVNIGSMRGFVPTTIDYSASKAALHNMTVSLAKALAPNVRVNCVAPGFTKTDMHKGNFERLDKEAELSLLKRYSEPEEIADVVLFLASAKAQSITGQVLLVDNGRTLN